MKTTRGIAGTWFLGLLISTTVGPRAAAEGDATPPVLNGLTLSPATVDISTGPAQVEVTVQAADSLAGVRGARALISKPSGEWIAEIWIPSEPPAAGTIYDGTFKGSFTVPQFGEAGNWGVNFLQLVDQAGNVASWEESQLQALGYTTRIVVSGLSDTAAPELKGLTLSPATVDISTGPAQVEVSVQATDSLAGVRGARALISKPSGEWIAEIWIPSEPPAAGTIYDGMFKGSFTVPQFGEGGNWGVNFLQLVDQAGNVASWEESQLQALGYTTRIVVTGLSDTAAPELRGLALSPAIVDVSAGPAQVDVSVQATDGLAGVRGARALISKPSGEWIAEIWIPSEPPAAGTIYDGTFKGSFTVPQFGEGGNWGVNFLQLVDQAGNVTSWDESQLQGLGYSTRVTVSALDITPPTVLGVCRFGPDQVSVRCSESLDPASAANSGNYAIDGGISVVGAALEADQRTVILTTSGFVGAGPCMLTVNAVGDLAQPPNLIAANTRVPVQADFVIEAEDFNYGAGQHVPAADAMPYGGGVYAELGAVAGVDYNGSNGEDSADANYYRTTETPNVGISPSTNSGRGCWEVAANYRVSWNVNGDWFNYTRDFPAGCYHVYAALGSGNLEMHADLSEVTAGRGTPTQTTVWRGHFDAPPTGDYDAMTLVGLKDAAGDLAILDLAGEQTLRFTKLSGNLDFDHLRLVPVIPPDPRIVTQSPDQPFVVRDTITLGVVAAGTGSLSYQWWKDGLELTGETAPSLTVSNARPSDAGNYTVTVVNSQGSVTSRPIRLRLPGAGDFLVEAEDFDCGGGNHVAAADSMPYYGGAYADLGAAANVDYNGNNAADDLQGDIYRQGEIPNVGLGWSDDVGRGDWSMTTNHRVGWNNTGDWFNYTRSFPPGFYHAYAAMASGGTEMHAELSEVTAGRGTATQTKVKLGSLDAPATGGWSVPAVVPLKDGRGRWAILELAGERTIRYTKGTGNADLDYLMFVPAYPAPCLSPSAAEVGSAVTLTVVGQGFPADATVYWNGGARLTTFVNGTRLRADIPATDLVLPPGAALGIAQVTVDSAQGVVAGPLAFTILSGPVTLADSAVAFAGGAGDVSTTPDTAGTAGVAAEIENTDGGPIEVTAVTYASNPTGVPVFDVAGGYVDLKIMGADTADRAEASFYYASTVPEEAEPGLALLYFSGTDWVPVQSSGPQPPGKDTTDNSNGTVSGGRFDVVFDATSVPAITDLGGTVFAATILADSPPVMDCPADVTIECGQPTEPASTGTATATDDHELPPVVTHEDLEAPGDCPNSRTITRVWTATDSAGQAARCTQKIQVVDTTPPTLDCPADIVVGCSLDALVPVSFAATAADACDPNPLLTYSVQPGAGLPVGETLVTCRAVDACGNAAISTFKVRRVPLAFTGFLPPLGGADATGGTPDGPLRTFKLSSTIPVKFTAACDGSPVLDNLHRLEVLKCSDTPTAGEPLEAVPRDQATTGDQFRLTGGQWHFNLDTQATGMSVGVWRLCVTLSDGSQHSAWIQLK